MILPSSPSIKEILNLKRLDPSSDKFISIFAPGVLVKFGSDHDAEVRALQFILGRLSVRSPRVLPHAPFTNVVTDPWHWKEGVWYIFMDECPGVPLVKVISGMSSIELDHIADQLLIILDEMRSYMSMTLGAITGGPYNNRNMPFPWNPPHAFLSIREYLDYYRDIFLEFCGPKYVDETFSCFPDGGTVLSHSRRPPPPQHSRDGSILDWETAGYYTEFWEYCRMHDPRWMTPAWGRVLARISPGPRRQKEIRFLSRILRDFHCNNLYIG